MQFNCPDDNQFYIIKIHEARLEQGRKELYGLDTIEPAWTNTGYIGIFLLNLLTESLD